MSLSFQYGEQLLSIDQKGRKKLFQLSKEHIGPLSHNDIHDSSRSISTFKTNSGVTIRQPSLEEYVLLMPRCATIAYPKDIWTMMGLLDVGPGTRVMEAGSGSGAMTLYLSRLGMAYMG